jgi:hypothetical protein
MTQNYLLWRSIFSVKGEFLLLTIKNLFGKSEIECFTKQEVQFNSNKSTNSEICVGTLSNLRRNTKVKNNVILYLIAFGHFHLD